MVRASMVRRLVALALLFGSVFAACGADSETDAADGEQMNVLDAASQPDGATVTVTGVLIEDTGMLFIADALAESFPPQPGGATLEVTGIDISQIDGVASEGPIRWLDQPVTIVATIQDEKLIDARRVDE